MDSSECVPAWTSDKLSLSRALRNNPFILRRGVTEVKRFGELILTNITDLARYHGHLFKKIAAALCDYRGFLHAGESLDLGHLICDRNQFSQRFLRIDAVLGGVSLIAF